MKVQYIEQYLDYSGYKLITNGKLMLSNHTVIFIISVLKINFVSVAMLLYLTFSCCQITC